LCAAALAAAAGVPCLLRQALAQVDNYLRRLNVVKEAVDDTAGAAQAVSREKLQASEDGFVRYTYSNQAVC
jgi:hypothetical protein